MKRYTHLLWLFVILSACETEIDLLLPPNDVPLVYSILNLSDTNFTVRLSKTFQMDKAFRTNLIPKDSLIFPDAEVWVERWNGDYMYSRNKLELTNGYRIDGIFPKTPNPIYRLSSSAIITRIFDQYDSRDWVSLVISIPDKPLVYSRIAPVNLPHIGSPRKDGEKINLHNELKPFSVSWSSKAYYSEGKIELRIAEVSDTDIDTLKYSWREYHSLPNPLLKRKKHDFFLKAPQFYERVSAVIKNDPNVQYRILEGLRIVYYCAGENLYQYNKANEMGLVDQISVPYTNIVNGIGLFASYCIAEKSFSLDYRSMDSLCNGQFTKHLNFRQW